MAACLLDVVPDSLADLRDELSRQSLSVPEGGGSPGGGPAKPHRGGPVAERMGLGGDSRGDPLEGLEVAADPARTGGELPRRLSPGP